jgi:uncharacterized protein
MNKLRKSSYIIDVKLENQEDKYLLVHGYTGCIDIVSEEIIKYLESAPYIDEKSFPFSGSTFDNLKNRGYITKRSAEEEQAFVKKLASALHEYSRSRPNFTFVLTYNCNFRCPYCFEKDVFRENKHWSKQVFSKEMVDRAYQVIQDISQNKNGSKEIKLYGGEPLMAENKEIVKYIVDKGVELGYHFYAITNGYDLDYFLDIIESGLIDKLQITIDGVKEYHNHRRIHFLHGNTFDKIIDNIKKLLDKKVLINIRMNTDMDNIGSLGTLKKTFQDLGFFNCENFSIYSAILDSPDKEKACLSRKCNPGLNESEANSKKDNEITYLNYRDYYDKLQESDFEIGTNDISIKNILSSIKESKPLPVHSTNCGAHSSMYLLDPYGDIYTCLQSVGYKEHIIGNYSNGPVWYKNNCDMWRNRNIGTVEQCSKCKYSLFCGGGCLAKHLARGGNLNTSSCSHFPYAFKSNLRKAYDKLFL